MSLEPLGPEDVDIAELARRAAARRGDVGSVRLNAIVEQALLGAEPWHDPHSGEEFLLSLGRYAITVDSQDDEPDKSDTDGDHDPDAQQATKRQTFRLALLRNPRDVSVTYVVDMNSAVHHPDAALFRINDVGVSFASDWSPSGNAQFLNNEQVLEIVEKISLDTQNIRWARQKKLRENIVFGAILVLIVALMATCIGALLVNDDLQQSLSYDYTTQTIKNGLVIPADGAEKIVPWSEQYDILRVKSLAHDPGSQIPTTGPRAISVDKGCVYKRRDILEGQQFVVVYQGTGEDEFRVAVDAKANHVEVCRTKSDGDSRNDRVIIQRVA